MKELYLSENDGGQRLDKFLKKATVGLPDSLLYKYLRKKCVKVNGRHVTDGAHVLSAGDRLQLYMNEDFFVTLEESFRTLVPEITVAYEDERLLVLFKEAGVSCHADDLQKENTLIDRAKAYLFQKGDYRPDEEHAFAPALANRIDRNTAGLVLCAKDAETLRLLSELIRRHKVEKEYRALVWGTPSPKKGTLTLYLKKDEREKRVRVFDNPVPGAKTAVTDYEVLCSDAEKSLLHIRLHTGRTHQIRASFAHIGHPLVGDGKYGVLHGRDNLGFSHQALLSYSVRFVVEDAVHPLFYLNGKTVTAPEVDPVFRP